MIQISRDCPFYYLTSVAHERLLIFQKDIIKQIICNAWNEARSSGQILIFAYVIMPDHVHVITDSQRAISEVLRYLNGISAKRLLDYLKQNGFETSLGKLRQQEKLKGYKHSVWQHHPNAFRIDNETTLMQKVHYLHQNPVRAGLVDNARDYRYSSVRMWRGEPMEEEPFITDHQKIAWRTAA